MNRENGAITPPKRQSKIHVQVRFSSEELHEEMKNLARRNERSLNGEIMTALHEYVSHRKVGQ